MKTNIFSFLILFAVLMCAPTQSSKAQVKDNVVRLSISNLIFATPTIYYERALNEKSTAGLGTFFIGYKVGDSKFSGFSLIPEYRFYPGENGAPKGFFVGPFLKYQNYSISADAFDEFGSIFKAKATLSGLGGGVVIGNQWLFGDAVSLDVFIGPSITSFSAKYNGETTSDDIDFGFFNADGIGVGVRFGISLGYAF